MLSYQGNNTSFGGNVAGDLFEPIITAGRFHPQFRDLLQSSAHIAARNLINAVYARMGDPNGNFRRDFQGHGFHARLFEIGCFAFLEECGAMVNRSFERPDFLITVDNQTIAVEAVTSNPSQSESPDVSAARMSALSHWQIDEKVATEFPRRIAASLRKKLSHHYEILPHVSGRPLVLMIAPFFEPGASFYIDDSLVPLLYGVPDQEGPASHFFGRADATAISAVLYCNAFSVSKFWRLADLSWFSGIATRSGYCYTDHNDTENAVGPFQYRVGGPGAPTETWAEGVTLFHNPNGRYPLASGVLAASSEFKVEDGFLTRRVSGFHPVASSMIVHLTSAQSKVCLDE